MQHNSSRISRRVAGARTASAAAVALAIAGSSGAAWANADPLSADGVARDVPTGAAADLPLDLLDVSGRTRFHLTARWTPASVAHVWHFDAQGWFQVTPGLAIRVGAPTAVLAPQRDGADDRFALGNLFLGVGGGTRLRIIEPRDADGTSVGLRLGGAFDVYFPTSPIPDDEVLTALAALHYRPLEPGLWVGRALAFRARLHVGVAGDVWSIDGELGLTPAFTLASDSDAWLWVTAAVRARVVLAEFIEPFLEFGGTITGASPSGLLVTRPFDPEGFQLTPGIRFHVAGISPAIFIALQPADDDGKITFGIDLAGAAARSRRNVDDDMLQGF